MVRAYSTQRRNRQRSMSCGSTRYTPSLYLPLQLLTALSTAQLLQHAIHFHSYTSQTHSIVTGSSFLRGGIAGAKSPSYETASIRKRGERHGSTISRPSLVSTMKGAKQARGNNTLLSCRTKDPRYSLSISQLTQHRGADVDADYHSRPHSHRSTIQHRSKPSSRRTMTRTRDALTAIRAAFSAVPSTPRFPPQASSGLWVRRPSRCRRLSARWLRWRAVAVVAVVVVVAGARAVHQVRLGRRSTRCCRISSRAC